MKDEMDIEYCRYCEEIHALNPIGWMVFNTSHGETWQSSDEIAMCPRCDNPLKRYEGYLEALRRRESITFINEVLGEAEDLSPVSLEWLKVIILNFSVPSFAVRMDSAAKDNLHELVRKRYVEYLHTNDTLIVYLNAYKLNLMTEEKILNHMVYQRGFISNPGYLVENNSHGIKRKARMSALVNDFSKSDKEALLAKFEGRCAFTGKDVPIHFDHVIPIAVGQGGTTKGNMLPIWQRINSSKNDRNIFEWYELNAERFEVCPERFRKAIEYIAELNDMTYDEYREYVYDCHANPNDILTEVD